MVHIREKWLLLNYAKSQIMILDVTLHFDPVEKSEKIEVYCENVTWVGSNINIKYCE